mgnify:CR=1 FL=1
MKSHDPIAYTYEANTHCPACAEARFGRSVPTINMPSLIATDSYGDPSIDREGNEVGVIAPCDTGNWPKGIYCGDCLTELSEPCEEKER